MACVVSTWNLNSHEDNCQLARLVLLHPVYQQSEAHYCLDMKSHEQYNVWIDIHALDHNNDPQSIFVYVNEWITGTKIQSNMHPPKSKSTKKQNFW